MKTTFRASAFCEGDESPAETIIEAVWNAGECMAATLDISEARKQLNTLDQRLRHERVFSITRHNRRVSQR
jgi:hypothetical protein